MKKSNEQKGTPFCITQFWRLPERCPLLVALVLSLCFTVYNLSFAQDKIVAVVNNDIITQKDLSDFINFMRIQLSGQYQGEELEAQIQSMKLDLLDKLIEDQLILQEAKKNKFTIDNSMVGAKINEIKKHYDSEAAFTDILKKQGLVQADLEKKIREQLLMRNIVEMKIKKNISVSPSEVTNFYQQNFEKFMLPQQREFESIAVNDANLAKEIFNRLKAGQSVEDLAKAYALTVNRITATQAGELRKDIEDVVFRLNSGQISEPKYIEGNYYIFKLHDIIAARKQFLSEAQDRIYAYLFNDKMQEELVKWLEQLRGSSYIKIIE